PTSPREKVAVEAARGERPGWASSNCATMRAVSPLPRALEARGLELVGHTDLGGKGDGMQIMRNGDVLYVGHMGDFGIGTSVIDISDVTRPRVVRQLAVPSGTHSHKVQLANGLLVVNYEQYPYRVGVPARTGLG